MGDLEKYIREHRQLFDTDQTPSGHDKRFREKLERKPGRKILFRHWLQVAASVAVILASAFVIMTRDRSGSKVADREIPGVVREADHYYAARLNAKYEQIRGFSFQDPEEKAILLDEIEELDAHHQQLMNDLEANPDDERVINALIRHYQLKLEVIDQVINQLKQLNMEKSKNHESEDV
ncbi:MAG TPA: hypothetical protein ENO20_09030 [Bacteroides sp.]|nr:hypothetical protein [Bacteroides sp.]